MNAEIDLRLSVLVAAFTIASGVFDALAFTHAAAMWKEGRVVWPEAGKSCGSFLLGMTAYWGAVRYLGEAGVVFAELQTLLWFAVTIVGVALLGGRFLHWQPTEQVVALAVMVGLGWLISRTGA